mgnify:CR=1 FL=1
MLPRARANILEAIGHTPLVKLQRLSQGLAADVYVKCEYMNPGGSMKDRMTLHLVSQAEARGELRPGGTVIEATSGNTGAGLAMIAAVRGSTSSSRRPGLGRASTPAATARTTSTARTTARWTPGVSCSTRCTRT